MRFRKKITKLLGEILVEKGIITAEQLNKALEIQVKEGGLIGEIIVSLGFATEEAIAQCLAHQYGFAYLPLENYEISKEITALIPKNVASHYCLIPLDKIGNTLTVVMANPLNMHAIEDIEDITSLDIQIFISTPTDIRAAIKRYYENPQS
jgi:type IV pilus assembly protein PilB